MAFTGINCPAVEVGQPVTPEALNAPAWAADDFQEAWVKQHRSLEGEHGELFPQASGTVRWDGSSYQIAGSAKNLYSVTRLAAGDLVLELTIAASAVDDWFPVVTPQGIMGVAWEYDDGATRAASPRAKCRIRIAKVDLVYVPEEPVTVDSNLEDATFRVDVYMKRRAPGQVGASVGNDDRAVKNRIAVDGVESAEHRNKLFAYVDGLHERFTEEHEDDGRHDTWKAPLGVFQVKDAGVIGSNEPGELAWSHGRFTDITWDRSDDEARGTIRFRVADGLRIGAALVSIQTTSPIIRLSYIMPLDLDAKRAVGEFVPAGFDYRRLKRVGVVVLPEIR